MIDDIEDNSKLRRGVPVAHSIFGVAPVINTANYVFFLGLERCHALNNPKAMRAKNSIGGLRTVQNLTIVYFPAGSRVGLPW
eukprot:5938241-Ditylum_brightwellii.AAC.1